MATINKINKLNTHRKKVNFTPTKTNSLEEFINFLFKLKNKVKIDEYRKQLTSLVFPSIMIS